MISTFFESITFLLILLNPFLVVVYLNDVMREVSTVTFLRVLIRAGIISASVFSLFSLMGGRLFTNILHADFASFQIFGGIIFLLIGLQFVFRGNSAIEGLRGESAYIAGAIAMPIMIGPGTISAAVWVGDRLPGMLAIVANFTAVAIMISVMMLLKLLHDYVRPRREPLIERYYEITGRITALVVGTIAIEMIMQGLENWSGVH